MCTFENYLNYSKLLEKSIGFNVYRSSVIGSEVTSSSSLVRWPRAWIVLIMTAGWPGRPGLIDFRGSDFSWAPQRNDNMPFSPWNIAFNQYFGGIYGFWYVLKVVLVFTTGWIFTLPLVIKDPFLLKASQGMIGGNSNLHFCSCRGRRGLGIFEIWRGFIQKAQQQVVTGQLRIIFVIALGLLWGACRGQLPSNAFSLWAREIFWWMWGPWWVVT